MRHPVSVFNPATLTVLAKVAWGLLNIVVYFLTWPPTLPNDCWGLVFYLGCVCLYSCKCVCPWLPNQFCKRKQLSFSSPINFPRGVSGQSTDHIFFRVSDDLSICNATKNNSMQPHAMQPNAMQHNAMPQCNATQCNPMQHSAAQLNTMQCGHGCPYPMQDFFSAFC